MSSLPRVSVVIPHHGNPAPTASLVRALLGQRDVELQVIVVDDASPDPLPDLPGTQTLRRAGNGGFGSTVNVGAREARHPYLLILNSDVEVSSTFVAELVAASAPWMPAVVSPRLVGPEGGTQWPGRHFPTVTHQVVEWLTPLARFRHLRALHELVGHDTRTTAPGDTPVDWVVGACMFMPTAVFEAVGGFDETFYMNAEEVDLQRRMRRLGVPSVVVDGVTLAHEGGGSSPSLRRRQWLVDGRERYAEKWGRPRMLKAGLSLATATNLAVNVVRQRTGTPVRPLEVAREEWGLIWGERR